MIIELHPTYQEWFAYLDRLRDSGVTNMYGAGVYLEDEFDLEPKEARKVLGDWMRTFSARHPVKREGVGKMKFNTQKIDATDYVNIVDVMIGRLGSEVKPTKKKGTR